MSQSQSHQTERQEVTGKRGLSERCELQQLESSAIVSDRS